MAATATTVESDAAAAPAAGTRVPPEVRRRLAPAMPDDGPRSWLWTAAVGLVGAVLRLIGLTYPGGKIFDEVYYATDAQDLLRHGTEWDEKAGAGRLVVHPPLGKWLIALGEQLFGYNELGWRLPSAVAGVASIVILVRLARRLFRSTALGCTAGLLLSLDGMHFVSSRVALLDIFLMLFVLAMFACLVLDRESGRARLLAALEDGADPTRALLARPWTDPPWWRLAAFAFGGAALAVKWSAVWYVLAFTVLAFVWEVGARRSAGGRRPWLDTLLGEVRWFAVAGFVVVGVYLLSWTGWFLSDDGYYRHWLADNGYPEPPVLGALYNLAQYHAFVYDFHTHLDAHHDYQSRPWQWLLLGRPVAYYWSSDGPCGAPNCAAEVLLLGTPLLWWSFIPALVTLTWWGISRRDWRTWAILAGAGAGIVPWIPLGDRTMFYFYALPSVPFLVLAVTMVLGMIVGPVWRLFERRLTGALIAGGYVTLVALCFMYFYPLYVGETLTSDAWYARIWLGRLWV